jgi:hypothetical protein
MRRATLASSILAASIISILLIASCSDDNGVSNGTHENGNIEVANDSLASMLYEMITETLDNPDSTLRPDDIDFTELHDLYLRIAINEPSNLDAKFGVAFTGLMVFLQNEELNDLVDRFKYVFDTLSSGPLSPISVLPVVSDNRSMMSGGLPMTGAGLLHMLPGVTALDYAAQQTALEDPTIGEIQEVLEDGLLPILETSRIQVAALINNPSYTFIVTAEMQGNDGAQDIVLDISDFMAIQTALYAAEAGLHIFFARNLDLSEYSIDGLQVALDQESDFLDLKPAGVGLNHMQTAKARLLSALDQLVSTLNSLISEIGTDQSDDFIQVDEDDEDELTEVRDSVLSIIDYFDGPRQITIEFSDEFTYSTMVDIRKFFDNPMGNPKLFVPGYTLTFDEIEFPSDGVTICYVWDAATFVMWQFPDPTFNGLLPDMTNAEIHDVLLNDLDFFWQQMDCGTFYFD